MSINSEEYIRVYVSDQLRKYIGMDPDINDINIICSNIEKNKLISKNIYNKVKECINKICNMTNDERLKMSSINVGIYDDKLLVNTIKNTVDIVMINMDQNIFTDRNIMNIDNIKNIIINMIMRGLTFMDEVVDDIVSSYLSNNKNTKKCSNTVSCEELDIYEYWKRI